MSQSRSARAVRRLLSSPTPLSSVISLSYYPIHIYKWISRSTNKSYSTERTNQFTRDRCSTKTLKYESDLICVGSSFIWSTAQYTQHTRHMPYRTEWACSRRNSHNLCGRHAPTNLNFIFEEKKNIIIRSKPHGCVCLCVCAFGSIFQYETRIHI